MRRGRATRTLAGLSVLLSGLLALQVTVASPASAATITLTPPSGPAGTVVTVTGSGFLPAVVVAFCWDHSGCSNLGRIEADPDGGASGAVLVPGDAAAGSYAVYACQQGVEPCAQATFLVTEAVTTTTAAATTTSSGVTTTVASTTTTAAVTSTTAGTTSTTTAAGVTTTSALAGPPSPSTTSPSTSTTPRSPTTTAQEVVSSSVAEAGGDITTTTVPPGVDSLVAGEEADDHVLLPQAAASGQAEEIVEQPDPADVSAGSPVSQGADEEDMGDVVFALAEPAGPLPKGPVYYILAWAGVLVVSAVVALSLDELRRRARASRP